MDRSLKEQIGDHWSRKSGIADQNPLRIRWWQSKLIIRHINELVCGKRIDGPSAGLIERLKEGFPDKLPLKSGVSVGGGSGQKEIHLLRSGVVEKFELFELSEARIAAGIELSRKLGVEDRVEFIHADAFNARIAPGAYDLVHWNNSLHHMLDVDDAVAWSRKVLREGGIFYMDDFIGASRFQWPDRQLEIASRVRRIFEGSYYLEDPKNPGQFIEPDIKRPNPDRLMQDDPSEAADSERILEAVKRHFPNAEIKMTGGVIYHLALNNMLHNFDEEKDRHLLDLMMLVDGLCANMGENHYAVALAEKC